MESVRQAAFRRILDGAAVYKDAGTELEDYENTFNFPHFHFVMPHPVNSASSLEDESGDPLQCSLTGLSITDARETETVESKSSRFNPFVFLSSASKPIQDDGGGFNPFAHYVKTGAGERDPVQSIEDLKQIVIPQQLAELQRSRRFTLNETDALYVQGRQFQKKWRISEEGFLNWKVLLSGWTKFPAVVLLNPSPWDHVPFKKMLDRSTTLSWLQETLAEMQLGLDEVIIFDMFPMLRDDLLQRMEPAEQEELACESFALTRASLALIQPQVLISCQCCTKPGHERWGFFDDKLAQQLCSSVKGAKSRQVQRVDVGKNRMHVVQGMHPQYVVQWEPKLESLLEGVFTQVFSPFGKWQSERAAMRQTLQEAWAVLLGQVVLLRRQVQLYRQLCEQAARSGVEETVAVGRAEELKMHLAEWERGNSDGAE